MKRATVLAHEAIAEVLRPGDLAIDATLGNGHDTLFLARLVGEGGRVIGFDIQAKAVASSLTRLTEAGVAERVELIQASHAEMTERVKGQAGAVLFNLGYLPGGDPETITQRESTLVALAQGCTLLRSGGILTCVCYPGHPGGLEEAEAVLNWSQALDPSHYLATSENEKGRHEGRPFLVSVKKTGPA